MVFVIAQIILKLSWKWHFYVEVQGVHIIVKTVQVNKIRFNLPSVDNILEL